MRNTRRILALLSVLTLVVLICACGTIEPDGRYEQLVEKTIDRQHDELEKERRQIAAQRHRDPIIAGAIMQAAGFLAAVVPLALALVLLRSLQHEDPDALVGELLLQEFTSERPLLIDRQWTAPAALEHERQAALPLADEDTPDASPEQDEKPED